MELFRQFDNRQTNGLSELVPKVTIMTENAMLETLNHRKVFFLPLGIVPPN